MTIKNNSNIKPNDNIRTPRKLVEWAGSRFNDSNLSYGHGTENPHDEAVWLVLRAIGYEFNVDEAKLDVNLDSKKRNHVISLVNERINTNKPLAYLLKVAWFAGLQFYVDERVLIPRSPIAELIEDRFSPWVIEDEVEEILDIGTGSGCIAIATALAFPNAQLDAVDISNEALDVARRNIDLHELTGRVHVIQSDLFKTLAHKQYDLIIANPPYVSSSEYESLPEEYNHEPRLGLESGTDGLDVIRRILSQAKVYMKKNGILIVEVGNNQETVIATFPTLPFIWLEFERGGHGIFLLTAKDL